MRSDMGRVVIERPRRGSSHESPKVRHFRGRVNEEGDYDGLTRLPSSSNKINGFVPKIPDKSFTDLLGPLRRYLRKNVGRPWDNVYSEASESLKAGGWGVNHVFTNHFLGEVDRTVYQDESGALISLQHSNRFGRLPLWGFYVHPRTGLLCYAKPPRRIKRRDPNDLNLVQRKDGGCYVRIKDLWFIAHYEKFGTLPASEREALSRRGDVNDWPNSVIAGKLWICRIEKSCNKKDLREINRALAEQ
jgi:hypothetical protein